jgi:hypothetical protein
LSRLTAKPPRPQCRPLLMTSVCLTAGLHRTLTLLVRSWRLLGTPLAAHGMEEFHNEAVMSDEEMVESSSGSLADWEGRAHSLEVWLPRARLAFAIITPSEVCTNPPLSFARPLLLCFQRSRFCWFPLGGARWSYGSPRRRSASWPAPSAPSSSKGAAGA